MIAASWDRSQGGLVELGKWQEKIQIDGIASWGNTRERGEVPVWLCG
jgi:hypothetical protein